MLEYLWLLPLGFVAGVIGSMVGLGGGFVMVPVLTFFGFSSTLAASDSLFAAFSNSVASTVSYAKQKRISYSLGIKLALFAIPGTVLGAYISDDVSSQLFKLLFGAVLVSSGVYIYLRRKMEPREYNLSKQIMVLAVGASFFAGIISSLFGIGGGTVFVPLMVIAIGLSMKLAAPTSQFILMFVAASGMLVHSALGHPNYYEAGMLSIGSFVGGLVGSRLSTRVDERKLRLFVIVVLGITAAKLIIDSLTSPS
ncbi:MAG: sulfite exporter TauE/SafE family protein [Thaumarchaeota archaeon]|nr:sulfite exporter TauE/SafE family protein [Nitrososphaerota archaeon]MDE1830797.1 sulfite exporter TauE/SafE family protein [Nitrososphaerota archaeon]MDE1840748.1 sulfite exporter TauE/SafE family protein [Nitrososphaerota archaeon]MDE1877785.1 sulfite exporter TauE/SafE family protein [Nitrososphaerota archaeon]